MSVYLKKKDTSTVKSLEIKKHELDWILEVFSLYDNVDTQLSIIHVFAISI